MSLLLSENMFCKNNPCFYGGSCAETKLGFKCNCLVGYYGTLCNGE